MLFYVGNGRNVLVTQSNLRISKATFYLKEFDQYFELLIVSTVIKPMPSIQIHSSLGGQNYLNIFGEEPVSITLSGYVTGNACETTDRIQSALGLAVDIFKENSVVTKLAPLEYRVGNTRARSAYLVQFEVSQDDSFVDIAKINMQLLAEPIAEITEPRPVILANDAVTAQTQFVKAQPVSRTTQTITAVQQAIPSQVLTVQQKLTVPVTTAQVWQLIRPEDSQIRINTAQDRRRPGAAADVVLATRGSRATGATVAASNNFSASGDPTQFGVVSITLDGFDPVNSGSGL